MRKLVLFLVTIISLTLFGACFVSAQTYAVVYLEAIDPMGCNPGSQPVYATNVVNDTANGILKFTVTSNPSLYTQYLGASASASDAGKTIDNLPLLKILQENDTVQINYKGCQHSILSVTKNLSANSYGIIYVGQANSVLVNNIAAPEFPNITGIVTIFSAMLAITILLRRVKQTNHATSKRGI